MKVLLTGSSGLIGRAVVRRGVGEHDFVGFDLAEPRDNGGVRGDVVDRDALLRAAEGCEAIVHTAALHGHFAETATARQYLETNVMGTQNVFEAALAHGIRRVVVASSLTVNIGIRGGKAAAALVDETTPPRPDHMYPLSKLLAEELGHFQARHHGLEVVQLRYSYACQDPVRRYPLGLLGRCICVEDIADATLLATTRSALRDEVLIIAAETPFTGEDVEAAASRPWSVIEKHWPGGRSVLERSGATVTAAHLLPIYCINRARSLLGWRPTATFETYLYRLGWNREAGVST